MVFKKYFIIWKLNFSTCRKLLYLRVWSFGFRFLLQLLFFSSRVFVFRFFPFPLDSPAELRELEMEELPERRLVVPWSYWKLVSFCIFFFRVVSEKPVRYLRAVRRAKIGEWKLVFARPIVSLLFGFGYGYGYGCCLQPLEMGKSKQKLCLVCASVCVSVSQGTRAMNLLRSEDHAKLQLINIPHSLSLAHSLALSPAFA